MLEGDYMGMQTPHIVGMNNPTTAFKENKQLRRHETPFDTRYHFMRIAIVKRTHAVLAGYLLKMKYSSPE